MTRGEFARIDRFTAFFPTARAPYGPGDDAAVLRPPPRAELCVTTDAIVEDVHFTRAHFAPADVGHKALAVNLSDLAAMGARPLWFLCALELPPWVDDRGLDQLARGMAKLARAHRVRLVGGNVSRAAALAVTVSAVGAVPRGGALLRSGARPGDRLYVSGLLGEAALGLEQLREGRRGRAALRQLRPIPRVRLGLLSRRFASAAIDLSDGLAQDAGHLARASAVRAEIELSRLPISAGLRRRAGAEAPALAAAGGEDYELLLAIPEQRVRGFEHAAARAGERVTSIGRVASGRGVILLDPQGHRAPTPRGFDHFEPTRRRIDPQVHHK